MSKMFEFVKSGYLHDLLWKYDTKPVITENGTDIDVSGLDKIDVNVPNPSTGKVNITSTAEVNVTNYAAAQVVDANLVAGNIKKDVPILGVTGSFEGGGGDFKKATLSITNNSNDNTVVIVPYLFEYDGVTYTAPIVGASKNTETAVEVILPNTGACSGSLYKALAGDLTQNLTGLTIGTTGDIEYEDGEMMITGDCSITIV